MSGSDRRAYQNRYQQQARKKANSVDEYIRTHSTGAAPIFNQLDAVLDAVDQHIAGVAGDDSGLGYELTIANFRDKLDELERDFGDRKVIRRKNTGLVGAAFLENFDIELAGRMLIYHWLADLEVLISNHFCRYGAGFSDLFPDEHPRKGENSTAFMLRLARRRYDDLLALKAKSQNIKLKTEGGDDDGK